MTKDEFVRLVETYGASERRWPESHRQDMIAWCSSNGEEAESILSSERDLDEALESVRLEPGTDMLQARIMSQVSKTAAVAHPQPVNSNIRDSNIRSFGQKAVAALMLFAFTVGFAGASFLKLPGSENPDQIYVAESEWEELATDYDMDDVYAWVETAPAP